MKKIIKKYYHNHKETIHNFTWRSIQIFGKQGITFLIFVLCAKLLTPYNFGIYNYALAIIFFLIMFGDFGISTATSKYVAEYSVRSKEKLKSVLFNSGIIILGLTLIISVLTILIGPSYLRDKYIYVLYLLPLIFLAPMTSLYDGIYRGLKKFKSLAIISLVVGLISLSFVYYFVKVYGLIGALIAQNLFYLLLLIGLSFGYREFHFKLNAEVMTDISKYSLIIGTSMIGFYLFSRINIILLGRFDYILEIGSYSIVNTIFGLLLIPFTIFANVIAPNITQTYCKNKPTLVLAKYKKYLWLSFFISMILCLIIFLIFPLLLKSFLNQYYNSLTLMTMNLLLIVLITQSMATIVSNGFSIFTGHAKVNMFWLITFGILNVPLTIILIKIYGFMGVIYSTILIKCISDISFITYYYYLLKNETKK